MGINSLVAYDLRPYTLMGIAEVNDVEKLNTRKDWIVGNLEPFSRTKAAEKEWKVGFLSTAAAALIIEGHSGALVRECYLLSRSGMLRLTARIQSSWPMSVHTLEHACICYEYGPLAKPVKLWTPCTWVR